MAPKRALLPFYPLPPWLIASELEQVSLFISGSVVVSASLLHSAARFRVFGLFDLGAVPHEDFIEVPVHCKIRRCKANIAQAQRLVDAERANWPTAEVGSAVTKRGRSCRARAFHDHIKYRGGVDSARPAWAKLQDGDEPPERTGRSAPVAAQLVASSMSAAVANTAIMGRYVTASPSWRG